MLIFDDKTNGAEFVEDHLVLNSSIKSDRIEFKATYYVNSDIVCTGKIFCMFDLFVLGNIKADEIDIKGKLVCIGKCEISKTATVQNGIWARSIVAGALQSHENIYAQEMDVNTVKCEGKIIVEKTLAVTEHADVSDYVLCGETAYGSGKIVANSVITGEPIDLDGGEESIVSPSVYAPAGQVSDKDYIVECPARYGEQGDYVIFLNNIINDGNVAQKQMASRYLENLNRINSIFQKGIEGLRDVKVLLDVLSIGSSDWFSGCSFINEFKEKLLFHFESLSRGENPHAFKPKPAKDLNVGDYVRHVSFGDGKVIGKEKAVPGASVEIDFKNIGHRKFSIPFALKFFSILGKQQVETPDSIRAELKCELSGYRDWLQSLEILYDFAPIFSDELYNIIYELLMANLGLKPKFVLDRFKEKGWSTNGK